LKKISVTIPDELHDKFMDLVPKRTRSKFISSVLRNALELQERKKAFEEIKNFKPFKVKKDSVEVLRELREKRKNNYLNNLT
jgi:hypothetical protein